MPRRYKQGGQPNNINTVKHAAYRGDSKLVRDRRTWQSKYLVCIQRNLINALGGDSAVTPQEALLIERASVKALRCLLFEREMQAKNGSTARSLEHDYLRWSRELREDLKTIGLERRVREVVPSLREYLRQKAESQASVVIEAEPAQAAQTEQQEVEAPQEQS